MSISCRLGFHESELAVHTWAGDLYWPWCLKPDCPRYVEPPERQRLKLQAAQEGRVRWSDIGMEPPRKFGPFVIQGRRESRG